MPFGIEPLADIADKANASGLKFPTLMRIVLPGLLSAGFLYPLIHPITSLIEGDFGYHWSRLLLFAGMTLLAGITVSILSDEIYKAYEGRAYWPKRLLTWGMARQTARAQKLNREQEELKGNSDDKDHRQYNEIWTKLIDYPRGKDDQPYPDKPTLLGNILYTYESYPKDRYGIDSVFYWPRIWMDMDKDKKEEIDEAWSVADGLLSLSAVSFLGGTLWVVLGVLDKLDMPVTRVPNGGAWTMVAGAVSILMGYGIYRVSLPFHRKNGDRYKSIFDLYRSKAASMTELKPKEIALWTASWAYFQYGLLFCPVCGRYNLITADTCKSCNSNLLRVQRTFMETGKFPLPPV